MSQVGLWKNVEDWPWRLVRELLRHAIDTAAPYLDNVEG